MFKDVFGECKFASTVGANLPNLVKDPWLFPLEITRLSDHVSLPDDRNMQQRTA